MAQLILFGSAPIENASYLNSFYLIKLERLQKQSYVNKSIPNIPIYYCLLIFHN